MSALRGHPEVASDWHCDCCKTHAHDVAVTPDYGGSQVNVRTSNSTREFEGGTGASLANVGN